MSNQTRFRRVRSQTTSKLRPIGGLSSAEEYMYINPSEPMFFLDKYSNSSIEEMVESTDFDILPKIGELSPKEAMPKLIDEFNTKELNSIISDPPNIIRDFISIIGTILTNDVWSFVMSFWPPAFPAENPKISCLLMYIIKMVHDSKNPMNIIEWCSSVLCPVDWHGEKSKNNSVLKAICLCKKKKVLKNNNLLWATLDVNDNCTLHKIDGGKLVLKKEGVLKTVTSKDNKVLELISKNGDTFKKIEPVDEEQCGYWISVFKNDNPTPLPMMFMSFERPLPNSGILALYEALTADDLLVAKALLQYDVSKVIDSIPLASAFLDVFSHAGKVNQLLTLLTSIEFQNAQASTVLRTNSHLTNMFKIFFQRYGQQYYQIFLKKAVLFIEKAGNINFASVDHVSNVLISVLRFIYSSEIGIPPQIRHFASILKTFSAVKFNQKQASYNSLSGFFCLRFLTSILSDPCQFDPNYQIKTEQLSNLIPFSQLLQKPLNLDLFTGQFEAYSRNNNLLKRHVFPKLVNFVFSIADLPSEPAKYEIPKPEQLRQSLELISQHLSASKVKFGNKYNQFLTNSFFKNTKSSTIGWNISSFILSFFKENLSDVSNLTQIKTKRTSKHRHIVIQETPK